MKDLNTEKVNQDREFLDDASDRAVKVLLEIAENGHYAVDTRMSACREIIDVSCRMTELQLKEMEMCK